MSGFPLQSGLEKGVVFSFTFTFITFKDFSLTFRSCGMPQILFNNFIYFLKKSAKSAKSARIKIQRSLRKIFATLHETTPKATK